MSDCAVSAMRTISIVQFLWHSLVARPLVYQIEQVSDGPHGCPLRPKRSTALRWPFPPLTTFSGRGTQPPWQLPLAWCQAHWPQPVNGHRRAGPHAAPVNGPGAPRAAP